ncbi:hypothetical protein JDV02_004469 [Purpureocillium takamizusanense]|uniref:Uncharacterized protein n=1 Tax=Purpureocillium takamizusanense TaxID=2060973 RepID=A0A9Q8V9F3_9HYPO|nr:uncharacterized protein JDV02_004469 [Purpureocillium takamizusanense]UNI18185.1 hypothetical protein JDV02_004469 [Purpureocillium takamizusanense]
MARFPFSMPGRKKSAPQLTLTEHMSKAQRVLGATPLSIDTPPHWDDNSSSSFSDEPLSSKPASYAESWAREFDDDHGLETARSENGWGEESDIIPLPLRVVAGDYGDDVGIEKSADSSMMRTSRSSSTIRSWYDRSKMPLAISQQTSSSAMAKGIPTKAERLLDVGDSHAVRPRKKPGKLDLAALVPGSRFPPRRTSLLHPQGDRAILSSVYVTKSPAMLTPTAPTTPRHLAHPPRGHVRPDGVDEGSRPVADGGNQWAPNNALSELPSLYDHYEQMSLRQIMKHEPTGEISLPTSTEQGAKAQSSSKRSSKTYDWLHQDPSPATPQTAMFTKPLEPSSPTNYAASISSRLTRASKMSRNTEQGLNTADLHHTSVLLLSSDSEDDNDDLASSTTTVTTALTATTAPKSPVAVSIRRPSTIDDDLSSVDSSHQASRRCRGSDKRSSKSSKRTSFASSNTHILIYDGTERSKSLHPNSRANTSQANISQTTSVSSRRASVASTYSGNSASTWHSRSGYIEEARAVTMHRARYPSNAADSEQDQPQFDQNVFHRESLSGSGHQLTPPLSPTSIDQFDRISQPSNDASLSHSRIMAVTRQEELLLAALRQRQDSFRCNVLAQLQETHEEDMYEMATSGVGSHSDRQSKGHRSKTSQGTVTGTTFDFGFPAPPSFKNRRNGPVETRSDRHRSVSRCSSSHQSLSRRSGVISGANASDFDIAAVTLTCGPRGSAGSDGQVDEASTSLDDMEPSPDLSDIQDWEHALSAASEVHVAELPWPMHCQETASKRHDQVPSASPHCTPRVDSLLRRGGEPLAGVVEESSEDDEDLPRPDSPISPTAFPAVPDKRMTRSNMVRLSAVGSGVLGGTGLAHRNEPGWWGDED